MIHNGGCGSERTWYSMFLPSCNYRWIKMEGSSDSGWKKSESFRLNSSVVWDRNQNASEVGIDNLKNQVGSSVVCEDITECSDISLRHWLDKPERSVDPAECVHIFRQIVEIVKVAHSQGINVHNVRPSCFVMSSFNHVSFIESASCSDSDSFEDSLDNQTSKFRTEIPSTDVSQIASEHSEEKKQYFPLKQILIMEMTWYSSPEEISGASSSCSSDIYRLGVLLFELFCPSNPREEKSRTMSSLKHRVLPPQLLLKWPKEASFCLWLLHPDPSSRPQMSELIQSKFLNGSILNLEEQEAALEIKEKIEEQNSLLDFLFLIHRKNQDTAEKLQETISLLSFDIDEVSKLQTSHKPNKASYAYPLDPVSVNVVENEEQTSLGLRKRYRPIKQNNKNMEIYNEISDEGQKPGINQENEDESIISKSTRVMKNFEKLEEAYFLTRWRPIKPSRRPAAKHSSMSSDGRGSIVVNEESSEVNLTPKDPYGNNYSLKNEWIHPFLEGLCKYLAFDKLKVKADLKQGDFLNSSNLVCSLSFDRDGEYFATAGINKKIKVFECDAILNEDRDIHYPVVEMACRSKLSSTCWNRYIKGQIASSNFEGTVQLWDMTRNQVLLEMKEHERRVWSIDFSSADPRLLASGSDDCSVKLWSINQGGSVGTIKTKANVCSVQFPLDSGRYLAFGSADHNIYYHDLRNSRLPLFTLSGHDRTVSYVKFVDSMNLVSSSTDNTVKLWDLSMCTSRVLDSPLQSFTGHKNVKNFVGLSVSEGYIATGSETNEVYIYHKAFPMPAFSYKFNTMDPLSGHEMDGTTQFISSVCWRGQSSTLVAANSTGNIKILEMV